jgi:small subunit ribosomal protein S21
MLIIPIKEGENIDKALKKYKKKYERTGIVKELRDRQHYTKKSVKRRDTILRAAFREKIKRQLDS